MYLGQMPLPIRQVDFCRLASASLSLGSSILEYRTNSAVGRENGMF
jgi:hypothetical protein